MSSPINSGPNKPNPTDQLAFDLISSNSSTDSVAEANLKLQEEELAIQAAALKKEQDQDLQNAANNVATQGSNVSSKPAQDNNTGLFTLVANNETKSKRNGVSGK